MLFLFAVFLIQFPLGNPTADGTNIYQYDAWNRPIQINKKGTVTVDGEGRITGGTLGALVSRYFYDGFSRLIRVEAPYGFGTTQLDYYYDGVRRIQETVKRDILGGGGRQCGIAQIHHRESKMLMALPLDREACLSKNLSGRCDGCRCYGIAFGAGWSGAAATCQGTLLVNNRNC